MNIQRIAELAGVSPATVSRVFSHYPGIREELREKVFSVAREHGYHPRFSARQKNVVILTPYNSVFPVQSCVDMILNALTQVLPERGFRLEILPVNNRERLESMQFCGALTIGVEPEEFSDWGAHFPVPLVILDRAPGRKIPEGVFFVRSDEGQGMRLAVEHLFERGCRRIGCIIHGTEKRGNAPLRARAVTDALRKMGLPHDPALIHFSGDGNDKYVELIGRLLKQKVDAVFCPGGNAGIVGLYAFSLFGRSLPEDVSFIASEQSFFSAFATPPQTTISPDYGGLAQTAADLLEKYLDNEPVPPDTVLPYRLIVRESVVSR